MTEIKQTIIRLSGRLRQGEIPLFRGAVMKLAGNEPAFHNHAEDSSNLYRLPEIQYKLINGSPAIVGVNCQENGADALEHLFETSRHYEFSIGRDIRNFLVESKQTLFSSLSDTPGEPRRYILRDWLPLNQDNYRRYSQTSRLGDRIELLDSTLVGNILSLYKSFGVFFKEDITAYIVDIVAEKEAFYKNVRMVSMDIVFAANVVIPAFISIGKGASRGFGVVELMP